MSDKSFTPKSNRLYMAMHTIEFSKVACHAWDHECSVFTYVLNIIWVLYVSLY